MDLAFPEQLAAGKRTLIADAAKRMDSEYGDDFLGLVLSGSAGRGLDTDVSDLDVLVILTADMASGPRAPSLHTAELDLIPLSLEHLETVAGFGSAWYGFRWTYAWAPTLLDRTGGRITQAIERQTRLGHDESMQAVFDGWSPAEYDVLRG